MVRLLNGIEVGRYMEVLQCIINQQWNRTLCDELNFWNDIMAEHAQFIDGMLDPTERDLKEAAQRTADHVLREANHYIRLLTRDDC